jgi:serine/threonine protein kinase
MNVYTLTGKTLTLRVPALNSGGEGSIHEIVGFPDKVAKIYRDRMDATKRENKISEMVRISKEPSFLRSNLTQDIAWPLSPLFDGNKNFVGFGMNRISAGKELDDLYVYPPKANSGITIENKIDSLISLCDVIERLHKLGQVFGDFNPNNIKIKSDWTVGFVDADSYHIKNANTVFKCVVCAPGYVAPELIKDCKGTTFADYPGKTFTQATDYFALAIHCFRMLMNGCHPYNGHRVLRGVGSAAAPTPTDKRVESGETPFFQSVSNCVAPEYAPDIDAFPNSLRSMFHRAFVEGHKDPNARPNASEWKEVLKRYKTELTSCTRNRSHQYYKGSRACPYCAADQRYHNKLNQTQAALSLPPNQGNVIPHYPKPTSVITKTVKSPVYTPNNSRFVSESAIFWVTSFLSTIVMFAAFGSNTLPVLYYEFFGDSTLAMLCTYGSAVASLVGTFMYNSRWSPGRMSGHRKWYEYILVLLVATLFVFGFGVAVGLIILALYIAMAVLMGALVIGILAAIFSGG